jgi:hypothetical protein
MVTGAAVGLGLGALLYSVVERAPTPARGTYVGLLGFAEVIALLFVSGRLSGQDDLALTAVLLVPATLVSFIGAGVGALLGVVLTGLRQPRTGH